MTLPARATPPLLATVLLAEDDTEESVMGSCHGVERQAGMDRAG